MARSSSLLLAAFLAAAVLSANAAHLQIFTTTLSGAAEAPPNNSPATGKTVIVVNTDEKSIRIDVQIAGLTGNIIQAHIHGPTAAPGTGTAGVVTTLPSLIGFPLGVTGVTFSRTYSLVDPTFYNPAFITANGGNVDAAYAAFLANLKAGKFYLNVHTTTFPGGEVRGFYNQVPGISAATFVGTGNPIKVTVEGGSAVYTNTLGIFGANLEALQTTTVSNKAAAGTVFTLPAVAAGTVVNFGSLVTYADSESNVSYTVYSGPAFNNADGTSHVTVGPIAGSNPPQWRISFEDRLAAVPDRPEEPSAPKDFNDFVIVVEGVII